MCPQIDDHLWTRVLYLLVTVYSTDINYGIVFPKYIPNHQFPLFFLYHSLPSVELTLVTKVPLLSTDKR